MADEPSAEELRQIELAIQLSLGGGNAAKASSDIIVIDDSEDEVSKQVIKTPALFAAQDDSATEESDVEHVAQQPGPSRKRADRSPECVSQNNRNKRKRIDDVEKPNNPVPSTLSVVSSALGGISRAEMEKERLARAAARQATAGPSVSMQKVQPTASTLTRIATISSLAAAKGDAPSTSSSHSNPIAGPSSTNIKKERLYWDGAILPTASQAHSGYDCLSFADVIGDASELQSALLTTFCGEPEWIYGHFPAHVRVALVMPCKEHHNLEVMNVAENFQVINPKRDAPGRGCMHIKLILLYYKTRLRAGVVSANLIDYDWSTIENACYVQDFPRASTPPAPDSSFLKTLLRTHDSLGTPPGLYKEALSKFDYSKADNVRLVLSVPGNHKSKRHLQANGHTALATAVQELKLSTPHRGARLALECQGSSIGQYTLDWMRSFYRSALGWDPAGLPSATGFDTPSSKHQKKWKSNEWPDVKVVYPTLRTVENSLYGPGGGGTLFCSTEQFKKPGFPRQLFHDSRSQREGLLQHTKMILGIVRPAAIEETSPFIKQQAPSEIPDFRPYGFLYIGSHNFTPAAWGRYSEKTGNLSISNHELGVIIALRGDDIEQQASRLVTWKRPLSKYKDKDLPWDQFKYRGSAS